jgi:hypothetical protein
VLVTIKVKEYNEAGGEGLMRHDRLQKYGVFYEGLTDPRAALECDRCLPHSVYGSSLLRNFPKFRRAATTKLTDPPTDGSRIGRAQHARVRNHEWVCAAYDLTSWRMYFFPAQHYCEDVVLAIIEARHATPRYAMPCHARRGTQLRCAPQFRAAPRRVGAGCWYRIRQQPSLCPGSHRASNMARMHPQTCFAR